MDYSVLLTGITTGFVIAIAVGPIGILCIRQTLSNGFAAGMATGLGAAFADAAFGSIAAFGLTTISDFLIAQQFWFGVIGGSFLCYLGIKTFYTKPTGSIQVRGHSLTNLCTTTFFLTMTNPTTILAFAALFTGFNISPEQGDYTAAVVMTLGVFLGSMIWWLILAGGISIVRHKLSTQALKRINQISGLCILGFGIFMFARLFWVK